MNRDEFNRRVAKYRSLAGLLRDYIEACETAANEHHRDVPTVREVLAVKRSAEHVLENVKTALERAENGTL